ncbi:zinc finger protein RFP-like [Ahaetulla prasina]|uniref:zinc finger protein RFP-like n=1 Tax=Ahaetulla prasina TaxID=499056 RepID=UPI002647141C|nr:zinc finger protein RFP-like [Ahaetulla prasina]
MNASSFMVEGQRKAGYAVVTPWEIVEVNPLPVAAEAPLQDLVEEATCSICRDFFQDPVLIPECGHNFCRGCLTRSWGTSESKASCPQCRRTFAPHNLLPNRQLARVAEVARRCGGCAEEEGGSFCPKHREPLKLFCKDHETLICVVCDRSKEHRGHSVIPAEEAFLEYQVKVEDCLKAQKEQKEKIATNKIIAALTVEEGLDIIKKVKSYVVAEFRELQLWLEGREKLTLARMEETKKSIMVRKEKALAKHMEEVNSLDHLIQEIEEKRQPPASQLLQDIGSVLKNALLETPKPALRTVRVQGSGGIYISTIDIYSTTTTLTCLHRKTEAQPGKKILSIQSLAVGFELTFAWSLPQRTEKRRVSGCNSGSRHSQS